MTEEIVNEEVEIDLGLLSNEELSEFEAVLVADYEETRGQEELAEEDLSELEAIKETLTAVRDEMEIRIELAESDDVVAQVQGDSFLAKVEARKAAAAQAQADAEDDAAAEAEAAAEA